jgi:16S rRNA (uracil1498-N3)-methyltransferase
VRLIIGPEGGWHPDEVALAQGLGIPLAGLGPLILRTETAGTVAAAIALALDGARANA